ncbi:BAAT/acyl-CoA thioester hydrolase protein [Ancylostoma duodenale]|uniref:BAAT/acyl-CoA thioester hydrolase protein n=1 Tax=Ancylostoma duodenale TaxID=51022 RepID=A0A0C2H1D3_9BILA|nr:BAAT/acyl-CoA thioester hydrolase protein [Ancylostoma duodenale]
MLHIDKADTLMKEELSITASSLVPNELYEIFLRLNHFMGTFMSRGVFCADDLGEIDVSRMAPLRGTYSGVRPMGLFEGLMPCEDFRYGNYCKCTPPNPFKFDVELRDCTGKVLCSIPIIKRWIHPAVVRREIEEDGLCGTLFIPPGDGPFPTILDMSGAGGGINEHKGATLSSEGFCVLSLAFFQYKTLISDLNDLDLDYFRKAIHWLISLPFTKNEIGIQGVSFGGLLVNMLAVRHPEIIAVCSINGGHVISEYARIKENGKILPYTDTPTNMLYYLNQTMCYDKTVKYMVVTEEADMRVETAPKRTAFRYVASLDDLSTPTVFVTRLHEKKLKDSGHYVEVDFAPGGHLMEPPYFPGHQIVYAKIAGCIQAYGGEPCLHGAGQNKIWPNTVAFFKRFLGEPQPLADYRNANESPRAHL